MKKKKVVGTTILLLIWGLVMAYASAQPYSEQDLRPTLYSFDLSWIEQYFGWVQFTYSTREISIQALGTGTFLEFFIRKGAHVLVFATLGFLTIRLLTVWSMKMIVRIALAVTVVLLAAMFDEYRHFLHPGRSGLIEDVVLDTVGGVIGITVYLVLFWFKHKVFRK